MVGGWEEKNMSCAAREVLLKANVQSVPTYPMSCFRLSPAVCKKLTSAVSNYWWGSSLDNHKIHWLRWEKLTRSKSEGGMGFRDFALFNKAMLGKQGWRLIKRPNSLCAQVLKGKYYPNSDFLSATKKRRSSATWRAILHGRDVLSRGLIKRVGPGDIDVWEDNWIPGVRSLKPVVRMPQATAVKVHDLFIPGTRNWDESVVRESFMMLDANEVLKIRPSVRATEDVLAWAFEKKGFYSVRSAYNFLKQEQTEAAMAKTGESSASGGSAQWSSLWKLDIPPKCRVFWWRVLHNSLPSRAELKRRHVEPESHYHVCGDPSESLYHVFFECLTAKHFWKAVKDLKGLAIPRLHPCSFATDILKPEICNASVAALIVCGAWALWTGRIGRRHGRTVWELGVAARYVSNLLEELLALRPQNQPRQPPARVMWEKPDGGWMKVNTDAGYDQTSSTGRTGVVIRYDGVR